MTRLFALIFLPFALMSTAATVGMWSDVFFPPSYSADFESRLVAGIAGSAEGACAFLLWGATIGLALGMRPDR